MSAVVLAFAPPVNPEPVNHEARYEYALRRQNPDFAASGDYPALRDPAALPTNEPFEIGAGGARAIDQHFSKAVVYKRQDVQIKCEPKKDDPVVHPQMVGRAACWGGSRSFQF